MSDDELCCYFQRLESIAFLDDDGNNIAMIDGEEEREQRLCLADEIRENHAKEG